MSQHFSDQYSAGCKARMNFVDESAHLMANNTWNEGK
jgi:hypothetical protein